VLNLSHDEQHRCECGSLLAKIVAEGIQLKCRRCKRIVVIAFQDITDWEQRTPSPLLKKFTT
jgi:phage FluMu protein Com